ncbi:MAG: peptide chain release factor 2 [Kosmotoga sp.]|nr:peptide chain release factor 2 [Kosmotoga sp.]MBO8166456.1 peptide chain release factor 2 [Kosmotoga sp.]MCD6160271.1 peptide chain release factor 2 [Kosmotoga sp.]
MLSYETNSRINELKEKFKSMSSTIDLEKTKKRLMEIEKKLSDPSIWSDQKAAGKLGQEAQSLRSQLQLLNEAQETFENIEVAVELAEEDESFAEQVEELIKDAERKVREFELNILLSAPYDASNAFLSIHPGAGGTESQDWASMLLRMYTRWAEKNNYKVNVIEHQPGDEAGIKSATVQIVGSYAYGKLKYESGVHRLVRISPFDANHRRHTSFASVSVSPEMEDDVEIEIQPDELRIDTYRAGGAGGQHVNRTESAVRITHLPTGIVVTCQNERSQHQNKATAMKILKAKLFELELEKKRKKKMKLLGEQKEIAWGSQIRSYVFQPYTMVKDHRTLHETGDIQAVMDGELDTFIEKELLFFAAVEKSDD